MNYLNAENISKSFGERTLFEGLSFSIHKGQKIAFIAKNGTGKTTILNIVAGVDYSDTGNVTFRKDLIISFLPQDPVLDESLTIEQAIFKSNNPILKVIDNYQKALSNSENSEAYQKAFEEMELHHAWGFETLYKQILFRLKLEKLDQKISELSGGQKKRLSLANALINKPDLLILDEPTNHLDLESITAFNNSLNKFKGTVLLSTHDHQFAQTIANRIVELTPSGVIDRYMTFENFASDQKLLLKVT